MAGLVRNVSDGNDIVSLRDILGTLGIKTNDPSLGGLVPPNQMLHATNNLTAFLRGVFPRATPAQIQQVLRRCNDTLQGYHKYYAGLFTAHAQRLRQLPNASITLRGSGVAGADAAGQTYAAKTAVPLYPAQSGTTTSASFSFARHMIFYSVMTGKTDADNGWYFVGGTMKFADDPLAGMEQDTSFSIFQPEVDFSRTPLGAYQMRCIIAPTLFNASAVHNRASSLEIIQGVTILFRDERCRVDDITFCPPLSGDTWQSHVAQLVDMHITRGPGAELPDPISILR